MQVNSSNVTITPTTLPILDDCTYTSIYTSPSTSNFVFTNNTTGPGTMHASDVLINGKSLEKTLESIQERLAILDDPNPEKLKKYAALKKAYEQYKLLEKLLNEE